MLIRLATPEDFERVGELTVAAYAPHTDGPTDFYIERLRDVATRAREAEVWVAEIDGQVVGGVTRTPLGSPWREIARDDEAEFRMLAAITSRPGEVVRRRSVVAAAWPDGAKVSENTVDSFMRRIRAKLDSIESPTVIETVRGVGFTTAERR